MKTIADRLKFARLRKGWVQSQLAVNAGVSTGTIGNIESGARQSKGSLPQIAEALGISHKWLADGVGPMEIQNTITAPMGFITASGVENQLLASTSALPVAIDLDNNPDYPAVRRVNVKAQAGVSGYAVEYMNDDGPPIVFRADWYKSKSYRPERMLAVRVSGESMIPSLYQDDLIVVNTEQTQPKQGVPFLVSFEGEVVVKRLVRDDGLWWLVSDNSDQRRYPRTKCNGGTEIIGEVVYRQTERI